MITLDVFTKSLLEFNNAAALFLPRLALAALILIIGWIIARFLQTVVSKALKLVRLDIFSQKIGISSFLSKGGIRLDSVELLGELVYWLTLFITAIIVLNALGLQMVNELFNRTMLYIPNVFVAALVIIFGSILARLIQNILGVYFNNIGIKSANWISRLAQYAILAFVVFIALEQLSIGGEILISAFQISFGAICLAAAIAFGLGGKTLAAKILEKAWKEIHKK